MDSESLTAAIIAHFERIEHATLELAKEDVDVEEGAAPVAVQPLTIGGSSQEESTGSTLFDRPHRYHIKHAFQDQDLYWENSIRSRRFASTWVTGILYRPQIVADLYQMIESVLGLHVAKGIIVKGPEGVGKSHSLINLVRKLTYGSNSKYLVTFIPDCCRWQNVAHLLVAICNSCGIPTAPIRAEMAGKNDLGSSILLEDLVERIDEILLGLGEKWVFVFDHIDKRFVKPGNVHARNASGLSFSFYFIKHIMKRRRITSVISAALNGKMTLYKADHEGFAEYLHCIAMTEQELLLLNDDIHEYNVAVVLQETSGVPLYTASFMENEMDTDAYGAAMIDSILHSLRELRDNKTHWWDGIVATTIPTLLYLDTDQGMYEKCYDTNFLVAERLYPFSSVRYNPFVPQVATAYRSYFWRELMTWVAKKERMLLVTCEFSTTTNKVRGCLF